MFNTLWNMIKTAFGPITFLLRSLASVWTGFRCLAGFVMGFVNNVVAPGLAIWNGTKSYLTMQDGKVRVSNQHMVSNDGRVIVENGTINEEEFRNHNFHVGPNGSFQDVYNEVQQILQDGDTVAVNFRT